MNKYKEYLLKPLSVASFLTFMNMMSLSQVGWLTLLNLGLFFMGAEFGILLINILIRD